MSLPCNTPRPAGMGIVESGDALSHSAAGHHGVGHPPEVLLVGFDSWMADPEVRPTCEGLDSDVKWILTAAAGKLSELPAQSRISPRSSPKELLWCCLVFVASRLQPQKKPAERTEGAQELRLDRLLSHCGFTLVEFFKELRQVVAILLPIVAKELGEGVDTLTARLQTRELQYNFVYTTTIMKRYQDMYASKFEIATPNHMNNDLNFRFGWMLYLVAKAKLLPSYPDLVSCYNTLVAIFNVLLIHMPARKLRIKLTDPMVMPVKNEDGCVNTVLSLAKTSNAVSSAVESLSKSFTPIMVDVMRACGHEPSTHPEAAAITPGCPYFAGLLDSAAARKAAMNSLEDSYGAACKAGGALYCETIFLDLNTTSVTASPLRMTPRISQWRPSQSSAFANSSHTMPSPLRNGLQPAAAPSPFTQGRPQFDGEAGGGGLMGTLSATAWLKHLSSLVSSEPSEELVRYFRSCDEDKGPEITARVTELTEIVFPRKGGDCVPEERRLEAVKVYYRVLENILRSEERRSHSANLTVLLSSRSFHRCLLACAFEVVVAAYKMITRPFPETLEQLGLKAFDMFKIINCFVQHEPTLPLELKRHLLSMEEQVVEGLAWAAGSSLYPTLALARAQLDEQARKPAPKPRGKRTLFQDDEPEDKGKAVKVEDVLAPPPGLTPVKTLARGALGGFSKPPMSPRFHAGVGTPPRHPTPRAAATPSSASTPQTGSAFHVFASPMKKQKLENGAAAPVAPPLILPRCMGNALMGVSSGRDTPVLQLVRDFFKKANLLAAHRLAALCERMDFAPHDHIDILNKVYQVVRYAILEDTHLLYGRHLDQILLSALYGVCKVHRLDNITFKEVTTQYRKLSGPTTGPTGAARQDVFRNVVLRFSTDGNLTPLETGDIIHFYNNVFVQDLKNMLIKMNPDVKDDNVPETPDAGVPHPNYAHHRGTPTTPMRGNSRVPPPSPLSRSSSQRDPGHSSLGPRTHTFRVPESPRKSQVVPDRKVFVSPMREPLMTPRTNNLYCATPFSEGCPTYMSPIPKGRIRIQRVQEEPPASSCDRERAEAIINGLETEGTGTASA